MHLYTDEMINLLFWNQNKSPILAVLKYRAFIDILVILNN